MPFAVASGHAVLHDDKIYVISGWSDSLGSVANWVQIYDPQLDRWQWQQDISDARQGFFLFMQDDQAYWGGGLLEGSSFNQNLLQWNFTSMPTVAQTSPVFDRVYSHAFTREGCVFLIGGFAADPAASLAFITGYDLSRQQIVFQETTTFPGELPYQQQAAEMEGQYYLFGGIYNGVLNRIYRFDPVGLQVARLQPNLMQPRAGGQAIYVQGKGIYLIGGYNEGQTALASVEIFNLRAGLAFTMNGPTLSTPRRDAMALCYQNYIYVFGGKDYRGDCLRTVERLDVVPATGVTKSEPQPWRLQLGNAYPNPFNHQTQIPVILQQSQSVRIEIISADGRPVKMVYNGRLAAAEHLFTWNGMNDQGKVVAAGVYFCRLLAENFYDVKKMLLLP